MILSLLSLRKEKTQTMTDSVNNRHLLLRARNLTAGYGKRTVIEDINFDIGKGDIVLLTGENGSGKSTLLKTLYGLHKPSRDSIIEYFDAGLFIRVSPATVCRHLLMGFAYVPQRDSLFSDLTIMDNLKLSGHQLTRSRFLERVDFVSYQLPWLRNFLSQKPPSMSGGECQIAAIAMALIHQPKLLLIDEPMAGLSPSVADHLSIVFKEACHCDGTSLLIVEHRLSLLTILKPRRIDLNLGRLRTPSDATLY